MEKFGRILGGNAVAKKYLTKLIRLSFNAIQNNCTNYLHTLQRSLIFTSRNKAIMKTTRKQYSTEELEIMLASEIEKCGKYVWSDKRKTLDEMIKMRKNAKQ